MTRAIAGFGLALALVGSGCATYVGRHEIQWDSRDQLWLSEASQVRVRNAQSRVFETTDERRMLRAVVATLQDLDFQIEVLDDVLGIVSAKKFLSAERPAEGQLTSYLAYDEESLVLFNRAYRSWGPFWRRSDLVRLTVTVRRRNAGQLIVRASAQHYLRPVEDAEAYQSFYASLERALFEERAAEGPGEPPALAR